MNQQIMQWLQTPAGAYLLEWECQQYDQAVTDIFGYHAVQIGMVGVDTLRASRISHRWQLADEATTGAQLVSDFDALPFAANSLDLVVLPHTLELSRNPHATLREVERVLVPEGQVVICGLNPASLWGLKHRYDKTLSAAINGELISYWRLRDWLRLLNFEISAGCFGCYRPMVQNLKRLKRLAWMDKAGDRWWPVFGAAYFLVATKKVYGMRLIDVTWKEPARAGATPVPLARQQHFSRQR